MAIEEGIKVTFGGDASGLTSAANKAAADLESLKKTTTDTANKTAASFEKIKVAASTTKDTIAEFAKVVQVAPAQALAVVEKATEGASAGVAKLNKAAKDTPKSIAPVVDSIKQSSTALAAMKKPAGDATQALTNISRVAQDAPYGFMGIANNLNPLIESFQRLKAETGSTKAAFSSLTAGLMGPAGIGLAVGVVSSLLIQFGGNLFDSAEKTKELDQDVIRLNNSLASSKARIDAVTNALQHLNALGSINIDILGQSKVLDLEGTSVMTREAMQQVTDERNRLYKIWGDLNSKFIADESEENKKAVDDAYKAYEDAAKKESELRERVAIAQRMITKQKVEDARQAAKEVQKNLEAESRAWAKYLEGLNKAKEDLKSFARAKEDFSQVPSLNRPDITDNFMAGEREGLDRGIKDEGLGVLPSKEALDKMVANQKKAADDAAKVWEDFNRNIANVLANVRAELLVGLGEGLGEALGGNGIDSLATSMLNTVGSALTELGKQLIITSTAIKAFKEATKAAFAGNPVLGIAVGVGLTAIGSAMKARANKVKTFAQGGIVSTPTLGVFGEYAGAKNNPEVVAPLNKLKSLLGGSMNSDKVLVHEIHGDRLKLILARTDQKQRRSY